MPPTAAAPAPVPATDAQTGINAILLGPPGSGKGTQVPNRSSKISSNILYSSKNCTGPNSQKEVLRLPSVYWGYAPC